MSDIKRNKYGTPDSWKRIVNDRDVDDPYRASYDDEDWLADLKDQYRKRAKDESDKWVKDHNDDFFKEGEDLINLEDEYYGKANEGHDAWNADPHTDDIRKRWGQADAYYMAAKKKGWRGTAAKQKGLVDQLGKEYEDYKKSFVDNYIGQDLNDRWNNRKHPMMDELNTINSNIEKEFKKAVRDKRKSFETALNGRQIYAGMTGQGADKKWDFFLEYKVSDPVAYIYNTDNPESVMKNIALASIRSTVIDYPVDEVITTAKGQIQSEAKERLQSALQAENVGLTVVNLSVQDAEPPTDEIKQAFKAVETAKQGKETAVNNARKYQSEQVPAAEAEAEQETEDAQDTVEEPAEAQEATC